MGSANSNNITSTITPLNNATTSSSLVLPKIATNGSSSFVQRSHSKQNNQPQKQQDRMCVKIYENNKKHSLARKNSILKNISLTNLNTHEKKEGCLKSSKPSMQTDFQSKLKYFSNNKKLIEESIEATICVQRALNVLCHHEILQSNQFNYLNAKNKRSLECKQKRYRNLQVREHKVMASMGQSKDENEKGDGTKQSNSLHFRKANSSILETSTSPNRPSLKLNKR